MTLAIEVLLIAFSATLLVPATVLFVECAVAAVLGRRKTTGIGDRARPRTAILVPAHDEESVLASTLRALRPELREGDRLLVVADNCTDRTAEIARQEGAEVIERTDPERRGKGYALHFGLEHLAADPPEVVVVIDADCSVSPGAVDLLSKTAASAGRPAQAEYVLSAPERPRAGTAVSALAFLVRNLVRPMGLSRLGLPCHLTGSGMAFPWRVVRAAPATGSYLVEDLLMGIELALLGFPPLLCGDAKVRSELPTGGAAARSQRRRWEHGHLVTLLRYAPRLLVGGLRRLSFGLVALGLDLLVPPLSFLAILIVLCCIATGIALALGIGRLPAVLAGSSLGLVSIAALASWARFGRSTLPARHLLAIPFYVLAKLPLYLSLLVRGRQKTWERTERR